MNTRKINPRFMFGGMYIFLVTGLLALMTSSILLYLIQDYGIRYDQGGLLLSVQAIGNLLSNVLSGVVASRIGRKNTLLIAAVLFTVGFGGVALMPPLIVLYALLFITGLAWGTGNNMVNFLVNRETDGDSAKLAAVQTCYSIGAFLAPLLVGLFVRFGLGWRPAVALITLFCAIMIPVVIIMPVTESASRGQKNVRHTYRFLRQWRYYIFILILFTYVGAEIGFSGWLVTYLITIRGIAETQAQSLLSILWVFMIAGRLAAAFWGNKVKKAPLLLLEGIGSTVAAVLLIRSQSPIWLTIAVILLGLSMSAFFGMSIANAGYLLKESAFASGLFLACGGLGATILPYTAGLAAKHYGLVTGLWFLAFAFALMSVLTLINLLAERSELARSQNSISVIGG